VSTVITGATKLWQLEANIAARDAVDKLDNEVLETIEDVLGNDPMSEE
jgi:aryl-alcohol dehydrogenase-like predicted oxidoreductase